MTYEEEAGLFVNPSTIEGVTVPSATSLTSSSTLQYSSFSLSQPYPSTLQIKRTEFKALWLKRVRTGFFLKRLSLTGSSGPRQTPPPEAERSMG
eukprot:CAMPEP_0118652610 /NCGR_PEP_ID=MMETSP0785-20121206/11406_1 /TAXON_ID=91992 /ORGANISM="Bolidomonas pacifica, Strain CCMP 1866" /LENGTH=93 /DNA_ID=CAMNT_0006545131 /DNA_START=138 /DNA_END=419 /DNA_ORIENTATION=-